MSKKQIKTEQSSRKETVTDATLVGQGKSGKGMISNGLDAFQLFHMRLSYM